MRTALSLRVDSEGTALRAAAVAASSRRSAHLFVPVALNWQGVVTNPSGGVVALRTINQMVNRSAAQCRAKQRAATPRGGGSRSATPTPGSAPGSRPGSALGTAGSRPGSALGTAPPLASDPGPPASLPAASLPGAEVSADQAQRKSQQRFRQFGALGGGGTLVPCAPPAAAPPTVAAPTATPPGVSPTTAAPPASALAASVPPGVAAAEHRCRGAGVTTSVTTGVTTGLTTGLTTRLTTGFTTGFTLGCGALGAAHPSAGDRPGAGASADLGPGAPASGSPPTGLGGIPPHGLLPAGLLLGAVPRSNSDVKSDASSGVSSGASSGASSDASSDACSSRSGGLTIKTVASGRAGLRGGLTVSTVASGRAGLTIKTVAGGSGEGGSMKTAA